MEKRLNGEVYTLFSSPQKILPQKSNLSDFHRTNMSDPPLISQADYDDKKKKLLKGAFAVAGIMVTLIIYGVLHVRLIKAHFFLNYECF
ncbi:hypothetical protein ACHQM5_012617 [Ranunculus cassubicifolius]